MDVIMPQLGETVTEGKVGAWYKKIGDAVSTEEPLFDLETDKVTTEVPAPVAGVLKEILVEAGISAKVGTRLAIIEPAQARSESIASIAAKEAVGGRTKPSEPLPNASNRVWVRPNAHPDGPKLSPVVRRLLGEYRLRAADIEGTGKEGRITREDVLAYRNKIEAQTKDASIDFSAQVGRIAATQVAAPQAIATSAPALSPSVDADDRVVPLNKIRRLTAAHMARSVAISPHTVQAVEVDFHAVDLARQSRGMEWKAREGFTLTYLPFVARAVCDAIAAFPYVNASFGSQELIVHKRIHLGIAVDLNFDGLMVTVVRDADQSNLRGLAREIRRLASAARNNVLKPDECAGGTYTISNSGSFGTLFSAPIINQPQVGILSLDGVRKKPAVIETVSGDAIAIRPIGVLAQTFDHRAFDGAYSAAFLRRLKAIIEDRDWRSELV